MFYYLLYDDCRYVKEGSFLEYVNPWKKNTKLKELAKKHTDKGQSSEQYIPQKPHMETEQGSIIFTDRNEELMEMEKLKLKQESMENFLVQAK